MLPSSLSAAWAVLLAVVPGFVAVTVWSRARTWKGHAPDLRLLLQSLALSLLIQVAATPLTIWWYLPHWQHPDESPWPVAGWLFFVVILLPVGGGLIAGHLGDYLGSSGTTRVEGRWRRRIARVVRPSPPPSVWDELFLLDPPNGCFVVVHYDDGTYLAGGFGSNSYALTSPEPHELYLEQQWTVDEIGTPLEPVPGSTGLMISRSDRIRSVRVLAPADDASSGSEPNQ